MYTEGNLLLPRHSLISRSQSQPIPIPVSRPTNTKTVCRTSLAITSTDLQPLLPYLLQRQLRPVLLSKDPYFPHIEQNDFQILDTKNINASLTLAYCGVRRGNSSRLWSLRLGTPQCLIEKLYARNDQGTTNDRFLLTPDFYNDVLGSDFNAFLDHMEGCSERIKLKFLEAGHDVSKWKSPVRSNRGVVQGLQVKVRMQILSDRMYALAGRPIQAVVKLSCVYFTPDRSGLSYEIIDLYSLQGEPKQEWVQTTIDSIVNSDVHSDMETVVT